MFLKARAPSKAAVHQEGPSIPDFMRVPEDENSKKAEALKQKLVEELKPTPDMINQVMGNSALLAGRSQR